MAGVRRARAAAGSIVFLAVAPGMVAAVVPWLLTRWRSTGPPVWLQALGWVAIAVGSGVLLEVFGATVWSFVHWYEEPTLLRQFGTQYEHYRKTVPGWWPRRPG
jgi:protein-S-isoprenylcysteine O-methyltransferase Ste14